MTLSSSFEKKPPLQQLKQLQPCRSHLETRYEAVASRPQPSPMPALLGEAAVAALISRHKVHPPHLPPVDTKERRRSFGEASVPAQQAPRSPLRAASFYLAHLRSLIIENAEASAPMNPSVTSPVARAAGFGNDRHVVDHSPWHEATAA